MPKTSSKRSKARNSKTAPATKRRTSLKKRDLDKVSGGYSTAGDANLDGRVNALDFMSIKGH